MNIALNGEIMHLRPERTRTLIYKTLAHNSSIDKFAFLHPCVAIFLSLLDGERDLSKVAEDLSYVAQFPSNENASQFIDRSMQNIATTFGEEAFIEVNESNKHLVKKYDALQFVVSKEKVNLFENRFDTPLSINFIITNECNRKCIYCYAERDLAPDSEPLPLARIKEILDEARDIKVNDITYSGGDPFMRKDIIEIAAYTLQLGMHPIISTKHFISPKKCAQLKAIGLTNIQVSIDSANKEVANFMIGSSNYFQEISKTIKNLVAVGLAVNAHVVVTPYNTFSIPQLLSKLKSWGVSQINLVQYGRSAFRHRDSLFLDMDAIQWLDAKVNEFKTATPEIPTFHNFNTKVVELSAAEKEKIFWDRAICSVGRTSITILPDGKMLACEQLPTKDEYIAGDLSFQSIMDVWNSKKLWDIVVPDKNLFLGQPCYDCDRFAECHEGKGRCIRDAVNAFGNRFAPSPNCPKAPPAPRLI